MSDTDATDGATVGLDFVRSQVRDDIAAGGEGARVHTRFPPEPNGYLHIGHAKSIVLNFGIAEEFGGLCNLRFDDTNPAREEVEYVESIQEDVRWLGFDWADRKYFASDYFEQLYLWAEDLVARGLAYVDHQTPEEIRLTRGTPTQAGTDSPYRTRTVDENRDLLRAMRRGDFPDGTCVLRAKIDMAHANITMRDPPLYRIRHAHHHRTGDAWCIYPTYDYAHGQSDAIEGITHSICTLEFENHRPLYDWLVQNLPVPHRPRQIEFARLNLTYTVMSKRKLLRLVQEKFVDGWDDPRMPTISGMRRRGYTAEAIREFCRRIGVSKSNSTVDLSLLEFAVREDLNRRAPRFMGVIDPVKLVITNWPADSIDTFVAQQHPDDPEAGSHEIRFGRELWIEREDFVEEPPRKWFRLAPGAEVRLKYAYLVRCTGLVRAEDGTIVEVHAEADLESRGGEAPDGRKVKGTIHWVSVEDAAPAEFRLYEPLFTQPDPDDLPEGGDFTDLLNPASLTVASGYVEPALVADQRPVAVQLLRIGYFARDRKTSGETPIFHRTVTLKDSWARLVRNQRADG